MWLEQAFVAYLNDTSTSKLDKLNRALKAATAAGCTDTAVYNKVRDLLTAIKKARLVLLVFFTMACVTITTLKFTREMTVIASTLFPSCSERILRI